MQVCVFNLQSKTDELMPNQDKDIYLMTYKRRTQSLDSGSVCIVCLYHIVK